MTAGYRTDVLVAAEVVEVPVEAVVIPAVEVEGSSTFRHSIRSAQGKH